MAPSESTEICQMEPAGLMAALLFHSKAHLFICQLRCIFIVSCTYSHIWTQGMEHCISWVWMATSADLAVHGAADKCCPAAGIQQDPALCTCFLPRAPAAGLGATQQQHVSFPGCGQGQWSRPQGGAHLCSLSWAWGTEQLLPEQDGAARKGLPQIEMLSIFEMQLLQSCPAIGLATAVWYDPGCVIAPDNILLP